LTITTLDKYDTARSLSIPSSVLDNLLGNIPLVKTIKSNTSSFSLFAVSFAAFKLERSAGINLAL